MKANSFIKRPVVPTNAKINAPVISVDFPIVFPSFIDTRIIDVISVSKGQNLVNHSFERKTVIFTPLEVTNNQAAT